MTRLILHIGSEKTGTTSIQSYLYHNRFHLRKSGYIYSTVGMAKRAMSHRALACAFYSMEIRDDLSVKLGLQSASKSRVAQKQFIRALQANVLLHPNHVWILSSEHFASRLRSHGSVADLITPLRSIFSDIDVVYYIRAPLSLAISSWSTEVRHGWLNDQFPSPPTLDYLCDFKSIILRWESSLQAPIKVHLYDPCACQSKLISDFLVNASIAHYESEPNFDFRLNTSLSCQQIVLLGALNKSFPPLLDDAEKSRVNPYRRILTAICSVSFASFPVFLPSKELREHYQSHYSDSNLWVHERYFPDREVLFAPSISPDSDYNYHGLSFSESALVRLFTFYSHRNASRAEYILLKFLVLLFRNYKLMKLFLSRTLAN